MNKSWLITIIVYLMAPIGIALSLLFMLYTTDWLALLFVLLFIFFISIFTIGFPFAISEIGAPKKTLPDRVNHLYMNNDIIIRKLSYGIYETKIGSRILKFDMRFWIFKKTHISDIILMYKHVYYYNKHKIPNRNAGKKDFFKSEKDLSIVFIAKNKTIKKYIIKNGKEKRSFLAYLKIKIIIDIPLINKYTRKYLFWPKNHHDDLFVGELYTSHD